MPMVKSVGPMLIIPTSACKLPNSRSFGVPNNTIDVVEALGLRCNTDGLPSDCKIAELNVVRELLAFECTGTVADLLHKMCTSAIRLY